MFLRQVMIAAALFAALCSAASAHKTKTPPKHTLVMIELRGLPWVKARAEQLTPEWETELPKFKTPGKLEGVYWRHLARIGLAGRSLLKSAKGIAATSAGESEPITHLAGWCLAAGFEHSRSYVELRGPVSKAMAELQALDEMCWADAGVAVIARVVAEVFDRQLKAKTKSD